MVTENEPPVVDPHPAKTPSVPIKSLSMSAPAGKVAAAMNSAKSCFLLLIISLPASLTRRGHSSGQGDDGDVVLVERRREFGVQSEKAGFHDDSVLLVAGGYVVRAQIHSHNLCPERVKISHKVIPF